MSNKWLNDGQTLVSTRYQHATNKLPTFFIGIVILGWLLGLSHFIPSNNGIWQVLGGSSNNELQFYTLTPPPNIHEQNLSQNLTH